MRAVVKRFRTTLIYLSIILMFISILFLSTCSLSPKNKHTVEFINNACIEPFDKYSYLTCNDMLVNIDDDIVVIPMGFETDLASIPRFYWSILSPMYTSFIKPAILHDYLYRCKNDFNRRFADEVLYYGLLSENVTPYTASKFYNGVRIFGSRSYKKDKECNYDTDGRKKTKEAGRVTAQAV